MSSSDLLVFVFMKGMWQGILKVYSTQCSNLTENDLQRSTKRTAENAVSRIFRIDDNTTFVKTIMSVTAACVVLLEVNCDVFEYRKIHCAFHCISNGSDEQYLFGIYIYVFHGYPIRQCLLFKRFSHYMLKHYRNIRKQFREALSFSKPYYR